MIGIVNYGLGNIAAIANIYKRLSIPAKFVSSPSDLANVDGIILPGVGAFDWAMTALRESNLCPPMSEAVFGQGIPVLGICVGMQMLASRSDEGDCDGLGWIAGEVKSLAGIQNASELPLPHMGWNDLKVCSEHPILRGLEVDSRFYFLHSYYFHADNKADVLAVTDYGDQFACVVQTENIYGVQFHPEKSHGWGIQLLKNFAGIAEC